MRRHLLPCLLASLLLTQPALAWDLSDRTPFRVRAEVDAPVLAAAGLVSLLEPLAAGHLIHFRCPCDAAELPSYDRVALHHHSSLAGGVSDGLIYTALGLAFVATALPDWDEGPDWLTRGRAMGADVVVAGESIAVAGALSQVLKVAIARPRPYLYDAGPGDVRLTQGKSYESMPSGNSTAAFSAMAALATGWAIRYPHSKQTKWLVIGGAVLATVASGLRVYAGKHFPSDLLGGALLGVGVGVAVPLLHER